MHHPWTEFREGDAYRYVKIHSIDLVEGPPGKYHHAERAMRRVINDSVWAISLAGRIEYREREKERKRLVSALCMR